jgi:hypothetical protein
MPRLDVEGELVRRSRVPGKDEAPVTEVDVVQLELVDRARSSGVDGGQGEDEPVRRCGDSLADTVAPQWLYHRAVRAADSNTAGGLAEDHTSLLAVSEQRSQRGTASAHSSPTSRSAWSRVCQVTAGIRIA